MPKEMPKEKLLVKIHETSREVVALADKSLVGKKFEDGKLQLDVNEHFFKGSEISEEKAIKLLKEKLEDDACFNFVGENSVQAGIKAGIINRENIIKIQGIPHAMMLM